MSDEPRPHDHAHEDPTPPDVPVDLSEATDVDQLPEDAFEEARAGDEDGTAPPAVDSEALAEVTALAESDELEAGAGEPDGADSIDGVDGISAERIVDYLDAGRRPYDPEIEGSPEAMAQLAALERLRAMGARLLEADAAASPAPDPSWITGVMDRVRLESRSGRQIPLSSIDDRSTLHITEGAVRSLIREAGDSIDGALVISCTIRGDVTVPQSPVRIDLVISGLFGTPLPALAEAVRDEVTFDLLRQTELVVESVDVTVDDIHLLGEGGAE